MKKHTDSFLSLTLTKPGLLGTDNVDLNQKKETERLSLKSGLECRSHDHLVVYSCSIWPSGYLVIRVMFKVAANVSTAYLCYYQDDRDAT